MSAIRNLSVLHIGPGKYRPLDRRHVTYEIWSELASGFRNYHVIARSAEGPADWSDGNLRITLLPSRTERESEFVLGQFRSVPVALRTRPDVVVCQSPPLGGLAALVIARLTRARVLMELHGAEFFARAKFGSRLWLLQRLTAFALRRADKIRVLSQGMRRQLIEDFGADLDARTSILPPRVNLSRFIGPEKEAEEGRLRLAMIGAVNRNKGQLRLIEALKEAPFDVELRIAGSGPDLAECRRRAEKLAEAHSPLRVRCEGLLSIDEIASLLHSSDVLVINSRSEGTPRAAMEAMAAGLPVVTTDAGYCAEVVGHGVEGFVVRNDSEIIEVLARLNSDRSLLRRMGAAARERAQRDYDSVKLFEEYRRLIAETANQ